MVDGKKSPGQAAYEVQRLGQDMDLSDDPWNTLLLDEDRDVWEEVAGLAIAHARMHGGGNE